MKETTELHLGDYIYADIAGVLQEGEVVIRDALKTPSNGICLVIRKKTKHVLRERVWTTLEEAIIESGCTKLRLGEKTFTIHLNKKGRKK